MNIFIIFITIIWRIFLYQRLFISKGWKLPLKLRDQISRKLLEKQFLCKLTKSVFSNDEFTSVCHFARKPFYWNNILQRSYFSQVFPNKTLDSLRLSKIIIDALIRKISGASYFQQRRQLAKRIHSASRKIHLLSVYLFRHRANGLKKKIAAAPEQTLPFRVKYYNVIPSSRI